MNILSNKKIISFSTERSNINFLFFRKMFSFSFLFLFVFSYSLKAQKKNIVIRVIQDQSVLLNDFETNIRLQKKSFKIQVMLENTNGVYVFASLKDSIYRFTENGPIRDFVYLPLLEIKDDEFNDEKELRISESGWSYWFYDPASSWHSFNRKIVILDSNKYVGTKTFKRIYDVAEGKEIKLKEIKTPLYLFFVGVSEYDNNRKPIKELTRKKVKITWEKED